MNDQHNQAMSQAVEREVRLALGDMHMQIIVLRQMLEMAKQPLQEPVSPPAEQPHTNGHAVHG